MQEPFIDTPSPSELGRFRDLLTQRLGWQFDDSRLPGLAGTLAARAAAGRLPCASYINQLHRPGLSDEWALLARELSIAETYFLRYPDQFQALVQQVLPERLAGDAMPLQILSMGCASGEEPYSLAIMVRECLPDAAARVRILGADLNPALLERARSGRYSSWSLRELPEPLRARWFRVEGSNHVLQPEIVRAVEFSPRNLALEDPDFWQAARFDVVFCRNLLMYFSFEQARAAIERIARSLVPGGYLFLGHAETLRGLSTGFDICQRGDAYFYRKQGRSQGAVAPAAPLLLPTIAADSWVEAIRAASARIERLSDRAGTPPAEVPRAPDLGAVHDSLQQERYGQALAQLDLLPAHQGGDPDVLLLRAVALCHHGELQAAQAVCHRLLADDGCNAGAHYVLALCHEAGGDWPQALRHDRLACHLDPDFAMPRLHLGLLARRMGESERAARELRQAAGLLRQEDAARLLLFGGGFRREALIALCQGGGR